MTITGGCLLWWDYWQTAHDLESRRLAYDPRHLFKTSSLIISSLYVLKFFVALFENLYFRFFGLWIRAKTKHISPFRQKFLFSNFCLFFRAVRDISPLSSCFSLSPTHHHHTVVVVPYTASSRDLSPLSLLVLVVVSLLSPTHTSSSHLTAERQLTRRCRPGDWWWWRIQMMRLSVWYAIVVLMI